MKPVHMESHVNQKTQLYMSKLKAQHLPNKLVVLTLRVRWKAITIGLGHFLSCHATHSEHIHKYAF